MVAEGNISETFPAEDAKMKEMGHVRKGEVSSGDVYVASCILQ
jgi:hypothetical protein